MFDKSALLYYIRSIACEDAIWPTTPPMLLRRP